MAPLVIGAPLAASLLILFLGRRGERFAGVVAIAAAVIGVFAALQQLGLGSGDAVPTWAWRWLIVDAKHDVWSLSLRSDALAAGMAMLVAGLSLGVLLFSGWYLHGDQRLPRYWRDFSFFVAAMQLLVHAGDLLTIFVAWELVGTGSWLLIGFWNQRPVLADDAAALARIPTGARGVDARCSSPAHAQLKAFLVNRVGDALMLAGIGLLAGLQMQGQQGLLLTELARQVQVLGPHGQATLTLAGLLICGGVIGKSAQFPLHIWLPDAMQGPTTASAIIHAATMVAAGIFLVVRLEPALTPDVLTVLAWIGSGTALLAASMACVQWDLKAVLAYSTISQLGLMLAAAGAGSSAAAMTHLFVHAIFKCSLFLCAGAVIHAVHGYQDLHRLGGLWRRMPVTAVCAGVAVMAIIGLPGSSGHVGKDGVIAALLAAGNPGPLYLVLAASVLTAVYMLRWWLRIFAGQPRDAHLVEHAHDPSPLAAAVLVLLALGCTAYGWSDIADGLGLTHSAEEISAHHHALLLALGCLLLGGVLGVLLWLPDGGRFGCTLARLPALALLWRACAELWWWDRLMAGAARRIAVGLAPLLARADLGSRSLDAIYAGTGSVVGKLGQLLAHTLRHGPAGHLWLGLLLLALLCLWLGWSA